MSSGAITGSARKNGHLWRRAVVVIKITIGVLLVSGLFYYDVITVKALRATFSNFRPAGGAFIALALAYILSALRWYFILRALGIPIRLRPCAEIFAMGTFANNLMLGGTGGDVVRAFYLSRHVHRDRAGGVISVLVDRAVGLFGMLTLAVVLGTISVAHVVGSPLTRTVFFSMSFGFAIGLFGLVLMFVLVRPQFYVWATGIIGTSSIVRRFVLRLIETVTQLRQNALVLSVSFILSVMTTLLVAVAVISLTSGLEASGLGWLDYANATIIATLASAIPITPGGVGVAEGAFAFLCLAWERYPTGLAYGSFFFGQRLIMTVISLLGCIAFVTYEGRRSEGLGKTDTEMQL